MAANTILIAVDLQHDPSDGRVVEEGVKLAKTHSANIELVFVIPDHQNSYAQTYVPADMRAQVQSDAEKDLLAFEQTVDWQGVGHNSKVLRGGVYEKIINHSNNISAQFIVIGANRPNLKEFFMGPNAARVARHANCSVLIVRP